MPALIKPAKPVNVFGAEDVGETPVAAKTRSKVRRLGEIKDEVMVSISHLELNSEQHVIGSLMSYPRDVEQTIRQLSPEDFGNADFRTIFETIIKLHVDGIEPSPLFVVATIKKDNPNFPNQLIAESLDYATTHVLEHVAKMKEASRRRSLRLAVERFERETRDMTRSPGEIAATMQDDLCRLMEVVSDEQSIIEAPDLLGKNFPEPKWAIDGLIPEGAILLCGPPKLGKSWLVLQIALAVTSGGYALGCYHTKPGKVLYLALEDTQRRLKKRLQKIRNRWPDMETRGLFLETKSKPLYLGLEAYLRHWLRSHPEARLVIIDTLARVQPPRQKGANGYTEDYRDMRAIKTIADEFHVAIVAVHHTRKMGDSDVFNTISGTQGLAGAADAMMVLQRERGRCDAVLSITGRDVEEAELAMTWDADSATWMVLGDASKVRLSKELAAVVEIFDQDPQCIFTTKQLYVALEPRKPVNVRSLLKRAVDDGLIRNPERGSYCHKEHNNHNNTTITTNATSTTF